MGWVLDTGVLFDTLEKVGVRILRFLGVLVGPEKGFRYGVSGVGPEDGVAADVARELILGEGIAVY